LLSSYCDFTVFRSGAQHAGHDQAAPPPDKTDTGKTGGMTSGKMMSQAITGQRETSKLVDQLMKSFAAIETGNDPTALREKLAEHGLVSQNCKRRSKPNPAGWT